MSARKTVRLLDKTGLFDERWYKELRPNAKVSWLPAKYHYALFAFPNNIPPNPLIDINWYRKEYPDVEISSLSPIIHYALYGADELRDPGPNFSTKAYLESSKNEAPSSGNPLGDCIQKVIKSVAAGIASQDYFYLQPEEVEKSGLFDEEWYLKNYSDVAESKLTPLKHFVCVGIWQNRAPNGLFDPDWYRQAHDEILPQKANPLVHYIRAGMSENRRPGPRFDPEWYAGQYRVDVAAENPVHHYIRVGKGLGYRKRSAQVGYQHWLVREQEKYVFNKQALVKHCGAMILKPRFLFYIEGTNEKLRDVTIQSCNKQIYRNFEFVDDWANRAGPLEYLVWLQAGDILHETALYEFASSINASDNIDLAYPDEDLRIGEERQAPYFKPHWSPDTLESFNYIGSGICYKLSDRTPGRDDCSSIYDFLLKVTEGPCKVEHIPKILIHKSSKVTDVRSDKFIETERRALMNRMERTGRKGKVLAPSLGHARYTVETVLEIPPLVSIVIPTAANVVEVDGRRIDCLMNLVGSIVHQSTYRQFEIIVVENGDLDASRRETLQNWGCKLATYSDPVFNIAKKLNQGACLATGEYLLLMNDDIEPLRSDWIARLADHLQKQHVGVVGAKLLFPDRTIQHAGVVSNIGFLDHVRKNYPGDEDGVFFSTVASRNYKAVTGACMLTRTELYRSVGGYTEDLPISFNDADYCMKLGELGYYSVYAAEAELTHFESQSRIPKMNMEEFRYIQERWGFALSEDGFYNEAVFEICPPTFELNWA
ncbi:MAG: hypothetical protein CMH45_09120 [Muricauda sp.]|nr:hypothetical protein [Allomuricauda sp.]